MGIVRFYLFPHGPPVRILRPPFFFSIFSPLIIQRKRTELHHCCHFENLCLLKKNILIFNFCARNSFLDDLTVNQIEP